MIGAMMRSRHRRWLAGGAAVLALAGIAATTTLIDRNPADSLAHADRTRIEAVVHDYILAHPEIIPEAINRLREKQSTQAYLANRAALETPFASAWAGAEKADVTLVMFSDYACGYCRASLPALAQLLGEDPKLKIVWREVPILGPGSEVAAKASLAAAEQGAFLEFHTRMFAAGQPDGAKVSTVLRAMKLDLRRAQSDINGRTVAQELAKNLDLMGRLDDSVATPTFFVGGQMLKGAVGYDALKQAIVDARKKAAAA
ncbi:MAG: oxidoreductase [Rhizorhabdus sp.]|nr:oxidoreductase [Rhizorhabdus sp.]